MSLAQQVQIIRTELNIVEEAPVRVIAEAALLLGLEVQGSLIAKARECVRVIGSSSGADSVVLHKKIDILKTKLGATGVTFAEVLRSACESLELVKEGEQMMHVVADLCLIEAGLMAAGADQSQKLNIPETVSSIAKDLGLATSDVDSPEELLVAITTALGVAQEGKTLHELLKDCLQTLGSCPEYPFWEKMKSIHANFEISIQPLYSREALFWAASQLLSTDLLGKSYHELADECLEALCDPQAPAVIPSPEPPADLPPALSRSASAVTFHSSSSDSEYEEIPIRNGIDFKRLALLVQQAEQALIGVEGKNVIYFLGSTGAGKTTYLHHIAGKRLVQSRYISPNGVPSLVYTTEPGDNLPGFVFGHSEHESGTSSVTQWLNKRTGKLYMDSPGQWDTRGAEINVATTICLRKIAERCHLLRFVVLLRCDLFGGADKSKALRELSSIVGSCLKDFKEHRYAFSFLFTHVSKLNCFPDSERSTHPPEMKMKLAREEIHKRIQDVLLKTTDSSAGVLSWIEKNLRKNNPSVGIFHPGWCSPQCCQAQSEGGKYLSHPASVVQCKLTSEQEIRISHQLAGEHQELQIALVDDCFEKVESYLGALRSIASFIPLNEISIGLQAAEAAVSKQHQKVSASVSSSLQDGLSDDSSPFTHSQARAVIEAFDLISTLGRIVSPDAFHTQDPSEHKFAEVMHGLKLLAEGVHKACTDHDLDRPAFDVTQVQHRLAKLGVWAKVHERFEPFFHDACNDLNNFLQCVMTPTDGMTLKQQCLAVLHLKHLILEASQSTFPSIAASHGALMTACSLASEAVSRSLAADTTLATSAVKEFLSGKDPSKTALLVQISEVFQTLEVAQIATRAWPLPLGSPLSDSLSTVWEKLTDAMTVEGIAQETERLVQSQTFGHDLMCLLQMLNRFVDVLPDVVAVASGAKRTWVHTREMVCNAALSCCNTLQTLFEQLVQERDVSIDKQVHLIAKLNEAQWLDSFMANDQAFVKKTLDHLRNTLEQALQKVFDTNLEAVRSFLDNVGNNIFEAPDNTNAVGHLCRMMKLSEAFPELIAISSGFEKELTSIADDWLANNCNQVSINSVSQLRSQLTIRLGVEETLLSSFPALQLQKLLVISSHLKVYPTLEVIFPNLVAIADDHLQVFSAFVNGLFSASGSHAEKDAVLCIMQTWTEQRYSQTVSRMMSLSSLREAVRMEMHVKISNVHNLLKESVEAAERELQSFLSVKDLSDEAWFQMKNNLPSLEQSIRLRAEEFGNELTEAMNIFNFKAIRKYLIPRNDSDVHEKQKCDGRLRSVATCINSKMSDASSSMYSKPADFANTFDQLQDAMHDIGDLLASSGLLTDMQKELSCLKERANTHFQEKCSLLNKDIDAFNVSGIFSLQNDVQTYYQALKEKILLPTSSTSYESVQKRLIKFKDDMLATVDKVILDLSEVASRTSSSSSEASSSKAIFEDVVMVLRQLNEAKMQPGVTTIYNTLVSKLKAALHDFHTKYHRQIIDQNSFPLGIELYSSLQLAWDTGLQGHLLSLNFDITEVVNDLQDKETRRNQALVEALYTESKIVNDLKPQLEKYKRLKTKVVTQKPDRWHEAAYKFVFGGYETKYIDHPGYQRLTADVEREVNCCVELIEEALSCANYESLEAHVAAMLRVQKHLEEFLPESTTRKIKQTERKVMQEFNIAVNLMVDAAQSGNHADLEFRFSRFMQFVHHLGCALPGIDRSCVRVNAALLEFVQSKVKSFDASLREFEMRKAVKLSKDLQKVAELLSSTFVVYLQDLRALTHVVDESASQISQLQLRRFGGQELQEYGKHCAVLKVDPAQNIEAVKAAFSRACRLHHPDKQQGQHRRSDRSNIMPEINLANEVLVKKGGIEKYKLGLSNLFQTELSELPLKLKDRIKHLLAESSFHAVKTLLTLLPDLKVLPIADQEEHLRADIQTAVREEVNKIQNAIPEFWEKQDFTQLQQALTKLSQMKDAFGAYESIYSDRWRSDIKREVESKLDEYVDQAKVYLAGTAAQRDDKMMSFAIQLILLGRIFDNLPAYKILAMRKVNLLLESCQELPGGTNYLFKLGMLFEQGKCGDIIEGKVNPEDERIGKVIVNEFHQFKEVHTVIFNQQTARTAQKDLSETIADIKHRKIVAHSPLVNLPVHSERLKSGFVLYNETYERHFEAWRRGDLDLETLAAETTRAAAEVAPPSSNRWNAVLKDRVPVILAGIFAYFTIFKSGDSFKRIESAQPESMDFAESLIADPRQLLIRPHVIQVLTILRLVGYDNEATEMNSHLMHVRTGEGKSIILGGCAVLFGLLGFKIRCVCYSEYLSQRDEQDFREIFQAFSVDKRIVYSTITAFGEDQSTAKGDLRKLSTQLVLGNLSSKTEPEVTEAAAAGTREAVETKVEAETDASGLATEVGLAELNGEELMLVDEVDVFFGPEFIGQTHNLVATVALPEVRQILVNIWSERARKDDTRAILSKIRGSPEYAALKSKLPGWDLLIDTEVAAMCAGLKDIDNPRIIPYYNPITNKIGYKRMDSVDDDVTFGYTTAFHYLQQAELKTLRDEEGALSQALQLRVPCGRFSYADFVSPKIKILGVSGTVEAVGNYEWEIMNRFGLNTYSVMPSVYPTAGFRFLDQKDGDPVTLCEAKEHHVTLATAIRKQTDKNRAVCVFVQDPLKMQAIESSPHFKSLPNKNVLKETMDSTEKDYVIKKAATSGQVTLCSAIFGRGTNFFCNDKKLIEAGGPHVIQTFFSTDKSEEIQIQGRTARQGQDGTYSLVLSLEDLQPLGVNVAHIKTLTQEKQYETLEKAREAVRSKVKADVDNKLKKAAVMHELSCCFFDAALAKNAQAAQEAFQVFYKHINVGAKVFQRARIVCLSDATGSMVSLWTEAKASINTMIHRINEIGGNNFELLWVSYKDYSDDKLIESSGWTSNPATLQSFLNRIVCEGGGDTEEAVERALMEARREHDRRPISRVLLIADAPPHSELKGQKLSAHNHVLETDYMTEANALRAREVPVYCFRVGSHGPTLKAFQDIASATNGKATDLCVAKLVDTVCISTLEDIGGVELVAEYKDQFCN